MLLLHSIMNRKFEIDMEKMMDNYKERKVDNTEINGFIIDTCYVTDSEQDYETAVKHEDFNDNNFIIVECYDTKENAIKCHNKWVKKLGEEIPESLEDVSTSKYSFNKVYYKK